jgi:hypothetical protein
MKTRGRLVLSVFVIAWMNVTLQPCLMAMELSPSDSASVSTSSEHDSHQGHSATVADHEDQACPHCPPSASHDSNSCAVTAQTGCDTLPAAKPGERILKVDLNDAFGDVLADYQYYGLYRAPPAMVVVSPDRLKPTFVVGPSINIRNCVFHK